MRRDISYFAPAGLILILGACVPTAAVEQPIAPAAARPRPVSSVGLETVIGRDARSLEAQFGRPDLDVREGNARKLQYSSAVCVLDAYLYPSRTGAEPVVTHIDTRLPDGRDIDRASCVAALNQQGRAR